MPEPSSTFGSPLLAAGYATSRPPLHRLILQRAADRMQWIRPFERALDVGCGAGLSTAALKGFAHARVGLEREPSMLQWIATVAPGAPFVVSAGEQLPMASASVDLITAAGSLNYLDVGRFFPEAGRVLRPQGVLLVYDFSQGRSFDDSTDLEQWHSAFLQRYPFADDEYWRALDPAVLANYGSGFAVQASESFGIALPLDAQSYTNYILTETNVAHALRDGEPEHSVREWCSRTLAAVFDGRSRNVTFPGYFVAMAPKSGS